MAFGERKKNAVDVKKVSASQEYNQKLDILPVVSNIHTYTTPYKPIYVT